jgi:hypothetical protein
MKHNTIIKSLPWSSVAQKMSAWSIALTVAGFFGSSVFAQLPTLVLSNKWTINASNRVDMANANNAERGIAINPVTGNVLLASRTGSNHIAVIKGADGSDLGSLDNTIFSGGTLALMHVRVADDGAIYACNLSAGTASILKIYRWNSEQDGLTNPAVVAFSQTPAPVARYGDSMDLRGAGTNTQIIMSGSSATVYGVFTTTDGTNFSMTEFPSGLGGGELSKGIAFDGTNNALYGKISGSTILHKLAIDFVNTNSTLITNITLSGDANTVGVKFGSSNGVNFVSAILTSTSTATNVTDHRLKVYTINNPSAPITSGDFGIPTPRGVNGNISGDTDIGAGMIVGLDTDNGITALTINFASNVPPSVLTQPVDQTNVLTGGYATFSVAANGTTPLSYQWKFNTTTVIPGATNQILTLTNLQAANAGSYSCMVTNVAGQTNSASAALALLPSVLSSAAVPLWSKSAGDLFFLQNDNTHRGFAYNPATGNLIVVSRTPTNGVHVLNGSTGAYVRSLDMSGLAGGGGTFLVNLVGAGDDGAIYVANLDTTGANYTIYRWADDSASTVASVAFGPSDPGVFDRIGDSFAVRGAGPNTQILAGSRNGTKVALFTTSDGQNFNANIVDVITEPAGLAGLGVAFGAGDTFWTKSSGVQFRHIFFDLVNGTNALLQTFATGQNTSDTMGVDPVNDLLAGMALATPDNVELYDVHAVVNGLAVEPTLIDQDFFKTDNVNGNGTGFVVFDVPGGRLFALDTNNGLLASKVVARIKGVPVLPLTLSWTGPSVLQSSTNVAGPYLDVAGATSPYTNNTTLPQNYFRLKR